ncbi:helix-turn-helix domain-containing protein [Enterovibrio makurazakiensis]|uniref:Helix-turn-helix domain-containing protein n=1 Tax=Enterovibrio gelatinilyticus TaxID=2899819 RepID=A0ABT5QYY3_9GAMM|nr:helix-turn-helix domain-containing protein [Enterovibrio sp. ZSDZ42]MDD1793218.1 helix-turn-helix domain-containing protein [Enterovibrio sp. ZSDZ42]
MLTDINYHPIQGSVLQDQGYITLSPAAPLSHWVHSYWQLNVPLGRHCYRSMPDNCVDVIANLHDAEDIFIVTPYSSAMSFELSGPEAYFGIRFQLLGHKVVVSTPLENWEMLLSTDTRKADVIPPRVLNAIRESITFNLSFEERCHHVSASLLNAARQPNIDHRLARFIRYCHHNISSNIVLSDRTCSEFGLSARQLRRLTQLQFGLSPREFARVMRFQHTLDAIKRNPNGASWADNYYDQSHFIREFKRMSGSTPSELFNLSVLYNID